MYHLSISYNDHYCDVIMGAMASQITGLTIIYSTVYSGADQRKHESPASLAFVRGIHRWPVKSPHKWPVRYAENVSIWWRHHDIDYMKGHQGGAISGCCNRWTERETNCYTKSMKCQILNKFISPYCFWLIVDLFKTSAKWQPIFSKRQHNL